MKNLKNKPSLSEISNHVLYTISNFNPKINNSATEILTKFVSNIISYMRFISEKINMKNKQHFRFIFERGLETLIHVFTVIFYYTKNLELTYHHTHQAYYFYIEFIEQISDDNVTYLQLTSRDAIMFVYKKTIFNLNNEYRKNMPEPSLEDKNTFSIIDSYTHIYKSMLGFIINHKDFNCENKIEYMSKCCNYVEYISEILNKNKIKKSLADCIYVFTNMLQDKKIEIDDFFKLIENFIKQLRDNKKIDDLTIKNRIHDGEINAFIDNKEICKIVDWIFKY
jgi:hypothetical protein